MNNIPRIIIIGTSRADADKWCRETGIPPRAETTLILVHRDAARGLDIRDEDIIFNLGGPIPSGVALDIAIARGVLQGYWRGREVWPRSTVSVRDVSISPSVLASAMHDAALHHGRVSGQ